MASTPKFNAKNLHYEKPEPAFLRRLRGQAIGAGGGDADRLNVQHARPGKKPRLEMDGDDDGPTIAYEDEGGGNVGRKEYEALTKATSGSDGGRVGVDGEAVDKAGGNGAVASGEGDGAVEEREKQKVADVGGGGVKKKRKVGKVVGGEDDADVEKAEAEGGAGARPQTSTSTSTTATTKSKSSKKQKKVKLSFDEPDS
jgi:Domain of unknown function (DUF4604)